MRQALAEALETDVEIETTDTPESRTFNDILASDGPKAALAWRAAQRLGLQETISSTGDFTENG
jgi:enoyl-CoA hydratase